MKVTIIGWFFIFATIVIGVAAVNTGNNLLYLIVSFLLSVMAISGTVGKANLSGLSISLMPLGSVFAGVQSPFILRVLNRKRFFPSFLISVEVNDSSVAILSIILPKESSKKIFYLSFPDRGKVKDVSVKLISPFPFRFFYRWKIIHPEFEVIVYPKPLKSSLREVEVSSGRRKHLQGIGNGEFLKLRNYVPGDEPKRIHWKVSAGKGELFTKEFSDTGDVPVVIDLQSLAGSTEEKLSRATYLILQAFRSKVPVGIRAGDFYIHPSTDESEKRRMLEFLALYGKEKL
ncbi:DUF58 domain-containing protein [Desulfurobacterium indicum]|uniref:Uncharacterized protein n=1 Tax=Desulfurobacterium indicum TaxID=1914305 RepID=A0A1R1MJP5_9BACT|nr:DUF58 domain-containing protein [Desulfurobacterium indicum]OMH39976.1 hypothetical protein BLW93_07665 [Desulfurobacterium indicum]